MTLTILLASLLAFGLLWWFIHRARLMRDDDV
jgi:hypothetical protein